MPSRIQRKRTKGWRKPLGAVCVTRPGRWGNPFKVGDPDVLDAATAVRRFELETLPTWPPGRIEPLRGRDLACYCRLDQPCHADILLEIANS